ncbi:hypothetical protein BgiMline_036202, partial [Biomphalaria glabrata]
PEKGCQFAQWFLCSGEGSKTADVFCTGTVSPFGSEKKNIIAYLKCRVMALVSPWTLCHI